MRGQDLHGAVDKDYHIGTDLVACVRDGCGGHIHSAWHQHCCCMAVATSQLARPPCARRPRGLVEGQHVDVSAPFPLLWDQLWGGRDLLEDLPGSVPENIRPPSGRGCRVHCDSSLLSIGGRSDSLYGVTAGSEQVAVLAARDLEEGWCRHIPWGGYGIRRDRSLLVGFLRDLQDLRPSHQGQHVALCLEVFTGWLLGDCRFRLHFSAGCSPKATTAHGQKRLRINQVGLV
mmetsp:Transcript_125635/g.246208  ORF Transcript_125635/g.246208 Transcript_125635/m.246208 type:complete len:231 (+) Transcript_125635:283-975(+)